MYSFIEKRACELAPVLTRHRRNLHQIPETGWNEKETCSYIAAELRQLGYEVFLGGPVTGHETGNHRIPVLRKRPGFRAPF